MKIIGRCLLVIFIGVIFWNCASSNIDKDNNNLTNSKVNIENRDKNNISISPGSEFEYVVYPYEESSSKKTIKIIRYNGTKQWVGIPDSINGIPVTAIYHLTFYDKNITRIFISKNITSIDAATFRESLNEFIVDAENPVFFSKDGLLLSKDGTTLVMYPSGKGKEYVIPEGITSIGSKAFINKKMISIKFPESLISIGEEAFCGNSLKSVIIPEKVETIGNKAFEKSGLASVSLSKSLSVIGENAFFGNQLTSIEIPEGVKSIGIAAFNENHLSDVSVSSENPFISVKDRVLFSKDGKTLIYYLGKDKDKIYTIPDNVTSIGKGAFFNNRNLTNITLPANLLTIGDLAFFGNRNLGSITIPSSVTYIGSGAFAYSWLSNGSLASINIPPSVKHIGDRAFANQNLTSANLPPSLINIPDNLFHKNKLTSIVIPKGVTSIGKGAFYENKLTNIILPVGVVVIGDNAFEANELTSIAIPQNVTTIGKNAFTGNKLKNIIIPASVTTIGELAFANNELVSITLPSGIVSIGVGAFPNELEELYFLLGRQAGTYTINNNQWLLNGKNIEFPGGNPNYTKTVDDFKLYWKRGIDLFNEGHYSAAVIAFNKAYGVSEKTQPGYRLNYTAYYTNIALAYRNRTYAYLMLKDYDRVLKDCQHLVHYPSNKNMKIEPRDQEDLHFFGYYLRGRGYYGKKEYIKAISDLTNAVKIRPNDLNARYFRADAYTAIKEFDKARADNDFIRQRDPNYKYGVAEIQASIINISEMLSGIKN